MSLPSPKSAVWLDLISGKTSVQFEFLAARILLGTVQRKFKQDPNQGPELVTELFNLFEKNKNLPAVQADLKKIA